MADAPCILGDDRYMLLCYNRGFVKINKNDDPIAIKLKERIKLCIELVEQYHIEKNNMKGLSYIVWSDGKISPYKGNNFEKNCIYNLNQIRQKNWYWKKLVD